MPHFKQFRKSQDVLLSPPKGALMILSVGGAGPPERKNPPASL